jgi:homoserine dehydrogenase
MAYDRFMTPRTPARQPLKVAILGLGTVGGAVAHALMERGADLAHATGGRPIHLVAVGVRDPERQRTVEIPRGIVRSADLAAIAGDPNVDVVVELLGGLDPAGDLIAEALRGGRSVVTANKALLARRGEELEAEARRTGAALRFEAAVGGGVPVLGPLAGDLAANRWSSVSGIVNGTTNFILTAMTEGGWDYGTVLADAQARGYAEADPSGDVEGRDAADKLAILVRLAFGDWPDVAAIRRAPPAVAGDGAPGITGISAEAISAAAELEPGHEARGLRPPGSGRGDRRGCAAGGHPGRRAAGPHRRRDQRRRAGRRADRAPAHLRPWCRR